MSEMLTAVKRSKDWSDLADYYLALQYVWNLVDNDLDWGFNQRIGAEMMDAFVTVKNVYAARFMKYSFDSISGASSQSVVKAKLFCPEIAGLFCRIAGLFCHDSQIGRAHV